MTDKMPCISVIIPVYQCESTLPAVINSVLEQSFTDFELLLIDDGSNDNSFSACRGFAGKDGRIRVFHQSNGGVSSARNYGLREALGEYIAFIDSDDWVEPDFLLHLYEGIQQTGADVCISGFSRDFYKEDKWLFSQVHTGGEATIRNKEELNRNFVHLYETTLLGSVWAKLLRKSIIDAGNLRFPEDIYIGEDILFALDYYRRSLHITMIDKPEYHYVCKEEDSLTSRLDPKKYEFGKRLFRELLKFVKEFGLDGKAEISVCNIYLRTCFKHIEDMLKSELKIDNRVYIKSIFFSEEAQMALAKSRGGGIEFSLYRFVLYSKSWMLIHCFAWLRWKAKWYLRRIKQN